MKPSLCGFIGVCSADDCQFEHDLEKVPEAARHEVDVWLTKRPPLTPLSKKPKVQKK